MTRLLLTVFVLLALSASAAAGAVKPVVYYDGGGRPACTWALYGSWWNNVQQCRLDNGDSSPQWH